MIGLTELKVGNMRWPFNAVGKLGSVIPGPGSKENGTNPAQTGHSQSEALSLGGADRSLADTSFDFTPNRGCRDLLVGGCGRGLATGMTLLT